MPDILQALYLPGAKSRQRHLILTHLLPLLTNEVEFREPFVGSGAIGLAVMARCPGLSYWLNDRDPCMACVWWSLRYHGPDLIKLIDSYDPNPDDFHAFKVELGGLIRPPDDPAEIVRIGFMKFALHQTSHSGYGSGVRGGNRQEIHTKMTARWKVDRIAKKILIIANRLRRCDVRITGYDCCHLIDKCVSERHRSKAFIYLDPPYLGNRSGFYSHRMSVEDHTRLADALQNSAHSFALCHSDHQEIRRLYDWAEIVEIDDAKLLIIGR
jgi:DNA adenine methylase